MREQSLNEQISQAIKIFWRTRDSQAKKQGKATGFKDSGARSAVTGGAQMKGFVDLIKSLLSSAGLSPSYVFCDKFIELPGWFRPEKKWDLLVVVRGNLVAAIEFKSQVGPSFGNNFNNRTEEALGSATDIWAAFREGAFKPSARPWLGYLMLLEDVEGSTSSVSVREPHFEVFEEFNGASYAKRYEILLTKLIRERLYDSACLIMSCRHEISAFSEPSAELRFENFIKSLLGRVIAIEGPREH